VFVIPGLFAVAELPLRSYVTKLVLVIFIQGSIQVLVLFFLLSKLQKKGVVILDAY
jgi:hypothetical protein